MILESSLNYLCLCRRSVSLCVCMCIVVNGFDIMSLVLFLCVAFTFPKKKTTFFLSLLLLDLVIHLNAALYMTDETHCVIFFFYLSYILPPDEVWRPHPSMEHCATQLRSAAMHRSTIRGGIEFARRHDIDIREERHCQSADEISHSSSE